MPILPYEPDIYPDTLLDSPPTDAKWWAVHTLARREKAFMRGLRQLDVPHYGPLIRKTTRSGRSVRTAFLPLFPGYVFLCGSDEQRQEALRTQCVFRIIEVPDQSELMSDLRQIRRLVASDAPLSPEPRFVPHGKARIRSGLESSRLEALRRQKAAAGESGKEAKRLAKEVDKQEDFLSELWDFEDRLRRAPNLHLDPDLNDGVVLSIAPLHELVPWKEAKKYWEEPLEGEYEWSSIGKQLREKGLVKC